MYAITSSVIKAGAHTTKPQQRPANTADHTYTNVYGKPKQLEQKVIQSNQFTGYYEP